MPQTLAQLAPGHPARICAIQAPPRLAAWPQQLEDLGFLPGEQVRVLRRALCGEGPLVVRLGAGTTIALRHAEAACIRVVPAGA